ncbi:HAMP domain-containing sensor histidine kinase [uncultured Methanoregula sp.]|uniref:sensor histidine kinase n=1 Tax=uncultured Methanoregula sp. TaxID=1005933 RepID=UPI002AAAC1CE|nr:HAMP domain-containing sensor histidine kinase [uncultured Methanoregula sp.]
MESGDQKPARARSTAKRDLIVIIAAGIIVFFISAYFDISTHIIRFLDNYNYLQLDEIFTVALIFVIGFALFSLRRWRELGQENKERRAAEEALTLANKKLSLLNSITRHDIVNQLTALRGFLQLSLAKPTDEQGRRYIEKELDAAERISRQILFTREYQDIGMKAPVWQNAAEVIRKARPESGTPVLVIGSELETLEILADGLLEKVIFNLVDNAMRHGGESLTTIRFSARETHDTLLLFCEDDGAGVSLEDKARLFTQGYGKNTGYGLFLIREILSITGITIHETGTPGAGARFEMTIPPGNFRKGFAAALSTAL